MTGDPKITFAPPIRTGNMAFESWCRKLNSNIVHRRHAVTAAPTDDLVTRAAARAKRAREFAAGRACAAEALATFGIATPVGCNQDRSPCWPEHSVGSISHSTNWTWAAVAETTTTQSIGIDTESIVSAKTRQQLRTEIASDREWQVAHESHGSPEQIFTLVFSAKEAFYKCWFPLRNEFFGFHDAAVEWVTHERVRIRLTESNPNLGSGPSFLDVFYHFDAGNVFTLTWMPQE